MQPSVAIYALWLMWFLWWLASAMLDARTRRLSVPQRIVYRLATIVGSITLLFGFLPDPGVDVRSKFWQPLDDELGWALVGVAFLAFCISCWARICLGFALPGGPRHRPDFVEKGPYKLVRHPIYMSVMVAAFATALLFGKPSSLGGAVLLAVTFLVKILLEERSLREESGAFDEYAERVPMLLPIPGRQAAPVIQAPARHSSVSVSSPRKLEPAKLEPTVRVAVPERPASSPDSESGLHSQPVQLKLSLDPETSEPPVLTGVDAKS